MANFGLEEVFPENRALAAPLGRARALGVVLGPLGWCSRGAGASGSVPRNRGTAAPQPAHRTDQSIPARVCEKGLPLLGL